LLLLRADEAAVDDQPARGARDAHWAPGHSELALVGGCGGLDLELAVEGGDGGVDAELASAGSKAARATFAD
jgi:hypothetical protein